MNADSVIYSEPKADFSCEKIILLDDSIRFVGGSSTDGNLLDLKYRDNINPLLSDGVLKNSVKRTALRYNSRYEDVGDMGMHLYTNFI